MTQSGPDAPAQSVGRVARLSGNVRQPNHVLANEIAGHKAERRPRAGEEWLAATKYDGVEVKSPKNGPVSGLPRRLHFEKGKPRGIMDSRHAREWDHNPCSSPLLSVEKHRDG